MPNGKVIRIPEGKTYGFIKLSGRDYFFHRSDFNGHWDDLVKDLPHQEINVTFDIVESAKGDRAENVRRVDYPN